MAVFSSKIFRSNNFKDPAESLALLPYVGIIYGKFTRYMNSLKFPINLWDECLIMKGGGANDYTGCFNIVHRNRSSLVHFHIWL